MKSLNISVYRSQFRSFGFFGYVVLGVLHVAQYKIN